MFRYTLVALLAVGLSSGHHLGNFQLGAPLKPDGTVDETPEVKLASAAHHAAHAMVRGNIMPAISTYSSGSYIASAPVLTAAPIVQATPLVYSSPLVAYSVANKYMGPPAPLNADGTVAETPEVQHAKATHFALYNDAAAKTAAAQAASIHVAAPAVVYNDLRYSGPAAPLNPDGTVAETPEVMHAKAVHFAAKEEAKARNYHASLATPVVAAHIESAPLLRYAGPAAPLNPDGTVAETAEVQHAKAVHFALYNDAAAKAAASPDYSVEYAPQYYGPGAPLNPDGTVAETPEVVHAKAAHFAAKEEAKARNYHAAISTPVVAVQPVQTIAHVQPVQTIAHVQPLVVAQKFVEPAPLNADGTVAETAEVQHAKAVHFSLYNQAAAKSASHVYSPSFYSSPLLYRHKRSLYHLGAPLNADGTVAETPEVMHAKAVHFAAKEEAKARNYHAAISAAPLVAVQPEYTVAHVQPVQTVAHIQPVVVAQKFIEPAPLNADGTVAETPEVQHAKATHFALYNQAAAKTAAAQVVSHVASPVFTDYRYAGPAAPLNPDGTVAETPEVMHAKAVHFAAKEEAKARTYHASLAAPVVAAHIEAAPVVRYAGPAAPLNADGTVAETPEVQAAKAVHYALYNDAASKSAPAILSYSAPLVSSPVISSVSTPLVYAPSHYAPAPLNADGTVAETLEVQQAKALHFALYNDAKAKTALHYY